jgi:hypothetical protein
LAVTFLRIALIVSRAMMRVPNAAWMATFAASGVRRLVF